MSTYVYKYVHPDYPWLYVGKSDTSAKDRINAHSKEEKFLPFLNDVKIFYIELDNKAQSKFVEAYLIDKYKPHLNIIDKYEQESAFELNIPEWIPYENYKPKCIPYEEISYKRNNKIRTISIKGTENNYKKLYEFYKEMYESQIKSYESERDSWKFWFDNYFKLFDKFQKYQLITDFKKGITSEIIGNYDNYTCQELNDIANKIFEEKLKELKSQNKQKSFFNLFIRNRCA